MQGVEWLCVRFVLQLLWQHNLARFVPQVQSVTRWVSFEKFLQYVINAAIDISHPFEMVGPGPLGIGQSAYASCPAVAWILVVIDWARRVSVRLPVHWRVVVSRGLNPAGRCVQFVQQQDRSVPPGWSIVCADIIGSFE